MKIQLKQLLSLLCLVLMQNIFAQPIETIIGTGVSASYPSLGAAANGDGLGTAINIKPGQSMCADAANNIYFTDRQGKYIRKWNYITHQVTTIAGNGDALPPNYGSPNTGASPGDGSLATTVNIQAYSICVTKNAQYLYISQGYNINIVNLSTGILSTVVGYNSTAFATYCSGTVVKDNLTARFAAVSTNSNQSLALDDDNNLYVAESVSSRRIRKIFRNPVTGIADGNSSISTLAYGTGNATATDGISGYSQIPPSGVNACTQPIGYGYVGSNSGGMSLMYRNGNLYFTELGSPSSISGIRFRKMNLSSMLITTLCYSAIPSINTDLLVMDNLNNMYAADDHTGAIYKVTQAGVFSTFFTPSNSPSCSGPYLPGRNLSTVCVGFSGGSALTFNSNGDLFFADGSYNTINKITFCGSTPEPIVGSSNVCVGSSISLSNTTTGGSWTSVAGRATIDASGSVTGTSAGVATIRYTLPVLPALGCLNYVTKNITVNAIPAVPSIAYAPGGINPQAGAPAGGYCANRTFTVLGIPNGGIWSTTGVLNVTNPGGVVTTGAMAGIGTLTYRFTNLNGCVNSRTINGSIFVCASRQSISNETLANNKDFVMYPNPAKTFISLNIETLIGRGSIILTDLYGKTVLTQPLSMGTNTIDVVKVSKGMYFVSIITSERKTTKKLIIE